MLSVLGLIFNRVIVVQLDVWITPIKECAWSRLMNLPKREIPLLGVSATFGSLVVWSWVEFLNHRLLRSAWMWLLFDCFSWVCVNHAGPKFTPSLTLLAYLAYRLLIPLLFFATRRVVLVYISLEFEPLFLQLHALNLLFQLLHRLRGLS